MNTLEAQRGMSRVAAKCVNPACVTLILLLALMQSSCSSSTSPGGGGGGGEETFFVDGSSTGEGTGGSWEDAFTSLSAAIAAAESGDEIWVVEGTYTSGTSSSEVPVVELADGIELYGGFDGSETQLADRDVSANPTVLDGGGTAYHVVIGADGAVLDGFTITGGNACGTGNDARGGGIYMEDISMTVSHCIIENNDAVYGGAGIYATADNSTIRTSTIRYNDAFAESDPSGVGGGLLATNGSRTVLDDCYFYQNTAERYGGALHVYESAVRSDLCYFEDNSITSVNTNGGCVYVDNNGLTGLVPEFTKCGFEDNSGGYGGAIFLNNCLANIHYCQFEENEASMGGGAIWSSNASPNIRHTLFIGNVGEGAGGIYLYGQLGSNTVDIFNCLFTANVASSGWGGGINVNSVSPNISSCTFANNDAVRGGGLHLNSDETPSLTNCILWGNTVDNGGAQIHENGTGQPVLESCCIDQAEYEGWGGTIILDPLWATGPLGSYYLSNTAAGEPETSPCIDAGSDAAALFLLDVMTTRSDQVTDTGIVDIGYHYPVGLIGMKASRR